MLIALIVAVDENQGIGKDNRLPWHLSADLKRFKTLTMGRHLIMGRKTYESIGRPLPGRTTIIITHNHAYQAEGCLVTHSLQQAFALANTAGETQAFVIGGGEIFRQAISQADIIYLTRVHGAFDCDTFFPSLPDGWIVKESVFHPASVKNPLDFTDEVLIRPNSP